MIIYQYPQTTKQWVWNQDETSLFRSQDYTKVSKNPAFASQATFEKCWRNQDDYTESWKGIQLRETLKKDPRLVEFINLAVESPTIWHICTEVLRTVGFEPWIEHGQRNEHEELNVCYLLSSTLGAEQFTVE